jgi:putative peptidoglycan lipid II flippase
LSELGDETGKRDALSGALRFILIATIPAAVGLILIGQPLIRLLERGAFDASASALVFSTLRFFALGLVVHSALEVVARGFYADKDTLTPLWAALGGALINLTLSFLLSDILFIDSPGAANQPDSGNVSGLALANTTGVAFEVLVLLWVLRRRWQSVNENVLARTVFKTVVASLVMALAIVIIQFIWDSLGWSAGGLALNIAQVAVESIGGGIIFLAVAALLKMEELQMLLDMVLRRGKSVKAEAMI